MSVKVDEVSIVRKSLFESGLISSRRIMVDVGAHKGSSFGAFVRSGWDVWAFEPNSTLFSQLEYRFGGWRNLRLFPVAISDTVDEDVSFYTSSVSSGISSLLSFHDSHNFSELVVTRRLDSLKLQTIDLLKIDTEGYDRHVLRSCGELRPRVIVTEYEDRKTHLLGYTAKDYADELVGLGYSVWLSVWDPIVRYGGDHNWRECLRYQGVSPDVTTWGNFIAVHESVGVSPDLIEDSLMKAFPAF